MSFPLQNAPSLGKHKGKQVCQDALAFKRRGKISGKKNVQDLLSSLKSCTRKRDLQKGRRVHRIAVETGIASNRYVAAALIKMYAKCNKMLDARIMFDSIHEPDVESWTALILGYADNGQGHVGLEIFSSMKNKHGCTPDFVTYVAALKACTSLAADEAGKYHCLEWGRQIHSEIGWDMNQFVQSALINMYAKCGSMEDARETFECVQKPDVVSWNALIFGYAVNGQSLAALNLFSKMKDESGCPPTYVTYIAVLKACMSLAAEGNEAAKRACLERAKEIHSEIGSHMNNILQSTLIDVYAKCGSMEDARRVFDSIQDPDVVCWTALILGYAEAGQGLVSLDLFWRMKSECKGVHDSMTYVAALKACSSLGAGEDEAGKLRCLQHGRQIHSDIGSHMNQFVQNRLVDMYAKCGSMEEAQVVFDSIEEPDVVSWSALILGYAESEQAPVALDLFYRMKNERKCAPDSVTYVAVFKACTSLAADGDEARKRECVEWGRRIHSEIDGSIDQFVKSTLINMYATCGSMENARKVFDSMHEPDVVSWNTLILGYAENGQGLVALDLFSQMKDKGRHTPTSLTYVAALKACSAIGALTIGRRLHSEIKEFNSHIVTCLVDLYAKCGSIEEAREVFELHARARSVPTWTVLLAGYARFGDTASVFKLFEAMQDQGLQPNAITFVYMLACCSHSGLVEKAWEYLNLMAARYGITPTVFHYNCMMDLLGRANKLDEAIALIKEMPCSPNAVTWMTLLGACRKWNNAEIGRLAFTCLVAIDKTSASAYILMAEIYGIMGMWEERTRVLTRMRLGAR